MFTKPLQTTHQRGIIGRHMRPLKRERGEPGAVGITGSIRTCAISPLERAEVGKAPASIVSLHLFGILDNR